MPGKPQRGRGKRSFQSKKKGRPSRPATVVQQPVVAQVHEPDSHLDAPVPSASVSIPKVKPTAVHYPYITTELRTIGILAGIMLIILIVLALALP